MGFNLERFAALESSAFLDYHVVLAKGNSHWLDRTPANAKIYLRTVSSVLLSDL